MGLQGKSQCLAYLFMHYLGRHSSWCSWVVSVNLQVAITSLRPTLRLGANLCRLLSIQELLLLAPGRSGQTLAPDQDF